MNINQLNLGKNAYFYTAKKDVSLTDKIIKDIFSKVSENKVGDFILYKILVNDTNTEIVYSCCVFKFEKKPDFLTEDSIEKETKFAYLIIASFKKFIVISKRNISGLDIYKYADELDYYTISRLYTEEETVFEKFELQNMNISDKALRRKTMESIDLKQNLSALGASKYILTSMRVLDVNKKHYSLGFNTSRINELGQKYSILDFFKWINTVGDKITTLSKTKETYLDIFASPVVYEDNITRITPIGVLFNFSKLIEWYENGDIEKFYILENKEKKDISKEEITKLLLDYSKSYEIIEKTEKDNKVYLVNVEDNEILIRKNSKAIAIQSTKWKNIKFVKNGENGDCSLNKYLNDSNNFFITFDKIEYVYYSKSLFKNEKLFSYLDGFMSIFLPCEGIESATSEKGSFKKDSEDKINFDDNSLFGLIENKLSMDYKYFICDDMGNEWADFIGISDRKIAFYHAKYSGKSGLSATKLQDVIGQALKNLGNLTPAENDLKKKEASWNSYYHADGKRTKIFSLRKGFEKVKEDKDNIKQCVNFYKDILNLPLIEKEIHLVIDSISKTQIGEAMKKLKKNEKIRNRNELIQIIWFVSALISSCAEMSIKPYIHCKK